MTDIVERIDAAIKRITTERRPPLSIPLHKSDVDVVLSDAKAEIERLQKIISDGDADSDAREAENERLRKVVDAAFALAKTPIFHAKELKENEEKLWTALRELGDPDEDQDDEGVSG